MTYHTPKFYIHFYTMMDTEHVEKLEDRLKDIFVLNFGGIHYTGNIIIQSIVTGNEMTITKENTQVLRKLTRDSVVSVTDRELVGIYFADEDGSEVLMECRPEFADTIISLWNAIVESELES